MAIDKSTWNKKVKVSQSTIDDIKGLGMAKALRLAKMNSKATQGGLVAEYQEATRRLYGDRRFAAATGAAPKKAAPSKVAPKPSNPRQADKVASNKASTSRTSPRVAERSTPAKKASGGGVSKKVLGVAGTAAAIGLLIAGRGKGAGTIAKLSPQVGRALKSPVGRFLTETPKAATKVSTKVSTKTSTAAMKAKDAAMAARGKSLASKGKPVSQSQYDAMSAAAKAGKGKVVKSAAPKKSAAAPKKAGLSAGRRWDANAPKPKATKSKAK
jgi:hypothetical protein